MPTLDFGPAVLARHVHVASDSPPIKALGSLVSEPGKAGILVVMVYR